MTDEILSDEAWAQRKNAITNGILSTRDTERGELLAADDALYDIEAHDRALRARVEKLEGLLRDGVEAVQGSATRRGAWAARAHSEMMR